MKKYTQTLIGILLILYGMVSVLPSMAQSKPNWAQKGVKALNKKRINTAYEFQVFQTDDMDVNRLKADKFRPLMEHIGAKYGADILSIRIDSLKRDEYNHTTYRFTFPLNGEQSEVYAHLVDDCIQYEDYVDNTYQFEMYQLYAVSDINVLPTFDEFELTRKYNTKPALMSLIPGLGQIYKGQTTKGCLIMGCGVLMIAGSIYGNHKVNYYNRLADQNPLFYDNYHSKMHSYRFLRNGCLILGGGLYIYNLIDAAVAKGARQVVIKSPKHNDVAFDFAPVAMLDGAGIGMVIRF